MAKERTTRTTYRIDVTAGGNYVVIIDDNRYSIGKLSDEQLQALKMAGRYRSENGNKSDGYLYQLIAMAEQIRRGKQLKNIGGQF